MVATSFDLHDALLRLQDDSASIIENEINIPESSNAELDFKLNSKDYKFHLFFPISFYFNYSLLYLLYLNFHIYLLQNVHIYIYIYRYCRCIG